MKKRTVKYLQRKRDLKSWMNDWIALKADSDMEKLMADVLVKKEFKLPLLSKEIKELQKRGEYKRNARPIIRKMDLPNLIVHYIPISSLGEK